MALHSDSCSGGLPDLWDDAKFHVHSIEYSDGVIGLLGKHVESNCFFFN